MFKRWIYVLKLEDLKNEYKINYELIEIKINEQKVTYEDKIDFLDETIKQKNSEIENLIKDD